MIRGSRVRGFIGGVGTVLALFWLTAVQAQTPCASLTTDIDGDGIPDINDNCINVPNANQRDTSGTGIGNACNPDLNHDGIVNLQDLALFKIAYAAYNSPAHTYTPNADFNGDGKIDTADLAILESYMGKPPGPSALVPTLRAIPTSVNFGAVFVGVVGIGPGERSKQWLSAGPDSQCNDLRRPLIHGVPANQSDPDESRADGDDQRRL